MKKWLGILGIAVLLAIVIIDLLQQDEKGKAVDSDRRTMVATDFELPTLNDEVMQLSDTRGKIVILNFWASWCQPCQQEAPHLQTFYEGNKETVEIIAINIASKDNVQDTRKFVEQYGLTFPVLLDKTGEISTMYGAFTIPTTIFLDQSGMIQHQIAGPMNEKYLRDIITSMEH